MAWRAPRYCYRHALRDAGAGALSIPGTSTVAAGYPLSRLIDERRSVNFKFGESRSDHWIQVNRSSGSEPAINRLFIPSGHNFSATTDIKLRGDSTSDMSGSPITLINETTNGADVGTGDIDIDLLVSNQSQYVRLEWPSQSGTWEVPELWLTATVTIARGPVPQWTDQKRQNAIALVKASGEFPVIETGAAQREIAVQYARTDTTDTAALEALVDAVGISKPFILDPPYDDEAAIVVKLIEAVRVTWDHPVPELGVKSKRFELRMLESLE